MKGIQLSCAIVLFAVFSFGAVSAEPAVKKSKTGICHPKGGTYYHKTKNYEPYQSMAECINSGGRKSKR